MSESDLVEQEQYCTSYSIVLIVLTDGQTVTMTISFSNWSESQTRGSLDDPIIIRVSY